VASISSPGIGSNLDVKTIVSQLMTAESQPLTVLASKEASFQAKLSSFGLVKNALSSLQEATQALNLSSTYSTVKPSVADSSVLSATVNGSTPPAAYNIEVKQLAEAQKLISGSYAATTSPVGMGTLTLSVGAYSDAATPPVTFTEKADSAKTITIDSSNNTLEGLRDAINDADAGVSATIINDGTGYRLAMTAKDTGLQNAVKIAATESGGAGLAQFAYDASAGGVSNLTQNVAAQNAVIKVDGITISKPANLITDAIQGVTLTLTKTTDAGTTTKLTLARDTSTVRSALEKFVTAYNNVNKQITDATAYDSGTGKGSILTGDATMRSLQTQLRGSITSAIAGAPAGLSTLTDIGIGFQTDGTLAIDSAKLDKVLADPLKDVSRLFTKSDSGVVGYASRINTLVSGMIFGKDALLNGRIDGINASIKDIDKQRDNESVRLAAIEKRYNAQFTALDTVISNMTQTSAFLTQQLAALSAQTK
jgi:flagellar hook-associated protein 2